MTMFLDPAKDIKIGTSGYSYPGVPSKGWRGAFYPEKKPKGFDELKYYSQLGVRLKGMPGEEMITKFPELVQGKE